MDKAKLVLKKKEQKSFYPVVLALDLRPPCSSESHTELSWLTRKASLTSYGLWHWPCLLRKHQLAASLEKGPREVSKNLHKVTCHNKHRHTYKMLRNTHTNKPKFPQYVHRVCKVSHGTSSHSCHVVRVSKLLRHLAKLGLTSPLEGLIPARKGGEDKKENLSPSAAAHFCSLL